MFKLMDKKIIAMLQINQKLRIVTLFTILICCSRRGSPVFINIYYKSFDIHILSSRTGSFYAFCINRLKQKDSKIIGQRSWYIYTLICFA